MKTCIPAPAPGDNLEVAARHHRHARGEFLVERATLLLCGNLVCDAALTDAAIDLRVTGTFALVDVLTVERARALKHFVARGRFPTFVAGRRTALFLRSFRIGIHAPVCLSRGVVIRVERRALNGSAFRRRSFLFASGNRDIRQGSKHERGKNVSPVLSSSHSHASSVASCPATGIPSGPRTLPLRGRSAQRRWWPAPDVFSGDPYFSPRAGPG